MKITSAAEMAAIDQATTTQYGVHSLTLMAVSYTHLDVYKRQTAALPDCSKCLFTPEAWTAGQRRS